MSKEYGNWVLTWSYSWFDVLKSGASIFIFAGRRFAHRVITSMEDIGFDFKDMLCWERDKAPHRAQRISLVYERRGDYNNRDKWNNWRVSNLRPIFEPILWFQKPYPTGKTLADNILINEIGAWNENSLKKYNKNLNILNQLNMIKVNVTVADRGLYVTQKPLELMKLLIELITIEGQTVLDPFAGSGTTLIAAKELNRNFIGFEIDKDIYEIAKKKELKIINFHINV
ncbi:MAG: site-specific DNA-methyltransferase [Defluviitaleaceae bacterium]|nr:site-specific DNA-methyltransferase [Defluviitaleaceae bacterium]